MARHLLSQGSANQQLADVPRSPPFPSDPARSARVFETFWRRAPSCVTRVSCLRLRRDRFGTFLLRLVIPASRASMPEGDGLYSATFLCLSFSICISAAPGPAPMPPAELAESLLPPSVSGWEHGSAIFPIVGVRRDQPLIPESNYFVPVARKVESGRLGRPRFGQTPVGYRAE
jgi:hypothetical protein